MNETNHVYEILEGENPYYTYGIHLSLDDAITAACAGQIPVSDYEGPIIFEIRRRPIGGCAPDNTGTKVATVTREESYDEKLDEWTWQRPIVEKKRLPETNQLKQ